MLKYILAFIPQIGTSMGALTGATNSKFEKKEDVIVAVATGILGSIIFKLTFEALENIRYSLFVGMIAGFGFAVLISSIVHKNNASASVRTKLFWAMLIHNIPEGIIVGMSLLDESVLATTFTLILAIALQNIPDGMVVSMSLLSTKGKKWAVVLGILSGLIEPAISMGIIMADRLASNMQMFEPFLIGFSIAAIFMIAMELLKECKRKKIIVVTTIVMVTFNGLINSIFV